MIQIIQVMLINYTKSVVPNEFPGFFSCYLFDMQFVYLPNRLSDRFSGIKTCNRVQCRMIGLNTVLTLGKTCGKTWYLSSLQLAVRAFDGTIFRNLYKTLRNSSR